MKILLTFKDNLTGIEYDIEDLQAFRYIKLSDNMRSFHLSIRSHDFQVLYNLLFRENYKLIVCTLDDVISVLNTAITLNVLHNFWHVQTIIKKLLYDVYDFHPQLQATFQFSYFKKFIPCRQLKTIIYTDVTEYKYCSSTIINAAQNGHIHCIQFLKNVFKQPWPYQTMAWAAQSGQLQCMDYLYKNGCPWDLMTTSFAAEYHHLDCLVYAHKNGCQWDVDVTAVAASVGSLECLQYAYSNGAILHKDTARLAIEGGHLNCLQYLSKIGSLNTNDDSLVEIAAEYNQFECLTFLHALGCPLTLKAYRKARKQCRRYILQNVSLLNKIYFWIFGRHL